MDCENVYTAVLTESGVEQISQDQLYFMIAVRWDFFFRSGDPRIWHFVERNFQAHLLIFVCIQAYNFVGLCHLDLAFTLSSWNMVSNNVMTLTLSPLVRRIPFFSKLELHICLA